MPFIILSMLPICKGLQNDSPFPDYKKDIECTKMKSFGGGRDHLFRSRRKYSSRERFSTSTIARNGSAKSLSPAVKTPCP